MLDKLGTIFGFTIGLALIIFGVACPDKYSNYSVFQEQSYQDSLERMRKERRPIQEIQKFMDEYEKFKATFLGIMSKFLDLKSFLIVFGGAYAACMIAFPFSKAMKTFVFMIKVFTKEKATEEFIEVYDTVLSLAAKRNANEIITESDFANVENEHLSQWIQDFILVDIVSEDMIQEIITSEIEMYNYRSFEEIDVLEFMGRTAPAFGMVGTVVGLILMLGRASGTGGSISDIMGAMSVALITTLYGVLVAQLIFIPIASKRYQIKESYVKLMEMIRESIIYLKRRELADVIAQDLIIYLPPKERDLIQEQRLAAMKSGDLGL